MSVSCTSPDNCVTVGSANPTTVGGLSDPMAELWNGSAWSAAATAPGVGGFGDISCPTTAGCYLTDGQEVAYWDGGTGVTTKALAVPAGGTDFWGIGAISCTAAQSCTGG